MKKRPNQKKYNKQIVLSLLFFFSFIIISGVNAQITNLRDLDMFKEMRQEQTEKALMGEDQIPDDEDISIKAKIQIIESSSNFGYQGGNTFADRPQAKIFDKNIIYFGYDYFTESPSTFATLRNTPVTSDYLIGPGDNFKIMLFGNINQNYTLQVTVNGEISIPELGPMTLSGLTYVEAKQVIEEKVRKGMIGTNATASLGQLRAINVFVFGEAFQPGMYTISSLSTLTNAIFASGGIRTTGSLRNIQLKRNGEIITTLDFYDLLLNGDTSSDIRLQPRDVVFIPPITKTVGIAGEVRRPAIYELNEGETVKELIEYAGSLTPKADFDSVVLERIDYENGGYSLRGINLDNNSNELQIVDGDFIKVYPVADRMNQAVLISGHYKNPGFYPWKEGMKLQEIITSYKALLPMTDMNYLLIKRKNLEDQFYSFYQVDLEEILSDRENQKSFYLQDKDEVLFFPSLISPENITTELVTEDYDATDQVFQSSLTYLSKTLDSEKFITTVEYDEQEQDGLLKNADDLVATPTRMFYEYTVNNYCTLPNKIVRQAVETAGYIDGPVRVAARDLQYITNVDEIQTLLANIKRTGDKAIFDDLRLTQFCRNQIIKPFMDVVLRQPSIDKTKRSVSIYGNVFFPSEYPLTKDMTLRDALNAAGGLKESAYASEIEIIRNDIDGKEYYSRNLSFDSNNKNSMDEAVEAMDVINVKQLGSDLRVVELTGEVYFPGVYPISKNETILDVLSRAGGLTEDASPLAANFTRESLRQDELKRIKQAQSELRRSVILSSQKQGFGEQAGDIGQITDMLTGSDTINQSDLVGRLVVDLEGMLEGKTIDVTLENGDKLHIPKKPQSVSVIGEVYVPNAHIFKQSLSVNEYIRLSGGANDFADDDNIYLVKADGSIISPDQLGSGFFKNSRSDLQPGDTIVVPLNLSTFSSLKATTELTQIIYQMALAAAAVNSF